MSLGPKGSRPVLAVLGAAGMFGLMLWSVPLALAGPGEGPALLPTLMASLTLAGCCGLWLGRRRVAATLANARPRLGLATEMQDLPQRGSLDGDLTGIALGRPSGGAVGQPRQDASHPDLASASMPAGARERRGPLSAGDLAALCAEEVRLRMPRLQAAIATGDTAAARMEAHAIRGMAASFGLMALAEALVGVEVAARDRDLGALVAAGPALPRLAEEALRQLAQQGA